jgi:GR25 family glycosyltransferase involved in LPS biosynthesis
MHALVINLEHRTDRREHMLQELDKLQGVTYEFVNAIKHENPNIGCTLSHQRCIEIAKDRDLNHIMILEDDVIFEPNVNEIFEKSWRAVQQYDWNLLYLGGNVREKSRYVDIDKHLVHVTKVNTTHAYVIHKRFYDIVLGLDIDTIIDYHYRDLSSLHKMYMCAPMIAFQLESYSDLQQKTTNYKLDMIKNFKESLK